MGEAFGLSRQHVQILHKFNKKVIEQLRETLVTERYVKLLNPELE
jgi:hypothetical protein